MQKLFTRNFFFIIIGQAVSMFGTAILKFTVSLYILDLTGSAAIFGTITAISSIPPIFLSPLAGVLVDRKNKRNMMVALDFSYGMIAVVLGSMLAIGHTVVLLGIMMILLSVISSFEGPVVQSSIPIIQSKDNLVKANAVVNQINMLAGLAGPLLAGMLYGIMGFSKVKLIIYGSGLCFFLAAILETFIHIPCQKPESTGNAMEILKKDIADGVHFVVKERPFVFKAILLNALFILLIQPFITVGAPYMIQVSLGLGSVLNGISQAAMGVAGLLGGFLTGVMANRFRVRKLYMLFISMGVSMLPLGMAFLFGLPPVTVYVILVICCVSIFLTASIAGIYLMSAIQKKVPEHMLGRVMSFYMTLANCALPIGMALYGLMYEKLSDSIYQIMFVTALLIVLIGFSGKRTYYELGS